MEVQLKDGFMISSNKEYLDLDVIYQFLHSESYWAKGIPYEIMEESIQHSICFGVYQGNVEDEHRQVGFARIITDFATFAYIADVFILSEFRKLGLSKALVQAMLAYPGIQKVRKVALATSDAHGLYRQFGFKEAEINKYMHLPRNQYQ
ncbi:GNAT family N-acetyltransferase [Ectobacillus polymachus]|uniref:GNAT family N-acetyltransferase n=1 Tax=Ectobacillus polymachus TaxID=1508806 RepID=UPI003A89F833